MKIAIHQPQYLPYEGYFDKINNSDVFVFLDDVKYSNNNWVNRNKIKGNVWITVPVRFKEGDKINEVQIDNTHNWRKKHLTALKLNYDISDDLKKIYEKEWNSLVELNVAIISSIMKELDINTKLVFSSSLNINKKSTERIIEICKKINADTYLSGNGAGYLDKEMFKKEGIVLEYQKFIPKSKLSIIDKVFRK